MQPWRRYFRQIAELLTDTGHPPHYDDGIHRLEQSGCVFGFAGLADMPASRPLKCMPTSPQ